MNRIQNTIIISSLMTIVAFGEPSVYGFSDVKKTKKQTHKMQKMIASLQQKVLRQEEKIEGLKSLVEGLVVSINEMKQSKKTSVPVVSDITIKRLELKIRNIENRYLTKEEFFKKQRQKKVKKPTKVVLVPKKNIHKEKKSTLFREGVKLFVKHRYTEAKKRFLVTDEKGYKTASSNYYLGEIAYYSKHYENAIFYFQKSAGINDETSYIPTLLLHTAISLERTGKKAKAKIFYENVIMRFDGQKVATIAKDRLKKL